MDKLLKLLVLAAVWFLTVGNGGTPYGCVPTDRPFGDPVRQLIPAEWEGWWIESGDSDPADAFLLSTNSDQPGLLLFDPFEEEDGNRYEVYELRLAPGTDYEYYWFGFLLYECTDKECIRWVQDGEEGGFAWGMVRNDKKSILLWYGCLKNKRVIEAIMANKLPGVYLGNDDDFRLLGSIFTEEHARLLLDGAFWRTGDRCPQVFLREQ